jgi:electron transfer flavoprotein beta subunit
MTLRLSLLVSVGRNPVSGAPRACRNDVAALEIARSLPGELSVLHAGDAGNPGLTDYLAYGTATVEVVPTTPDSDTIAALADQLAGTDLILCGSRAEDGEESGMLPYLVAERLKLPLVSQALSLAIVGDEAEITQFLPKGARRLVRVALPAVVCVHPMAPVTPRYAFARKQAGKIVARASTAETLTSPLSSWQVEPTTRAPIKFKAHKKEAGHNRMLSAIAPTSKGGEVLTEGSAAEKAQAILGYLRRHRLTDH